MWLFIYFSNMVSSLGHLFGERKTENYYYLHMSAWLWCFWFIRMIKFSNEFHTATLLKVFRARILSFKMLRHSSMVISWFLAIVLSTSVSTFGFSDSEASVSVNVFGRHGAFHDSALKRKNNRWSTFYFALIKPLNLPIAASTVLISVFSRFTIDETMLIRSFSFGA